MGIYGEAEIKNAEILLEMRDFLGNLVSRLEIDTVPFVKKEHRWRVISGGLNLVREVCQYESVVYEVFLAQRSEEKRREFW